MYKLRVTGTILIEQVAGGRRSRQCVAESRIRRDYREKKPACQSVKLYNDKSKASFPIVNINQ